jgi:hypothetical protein
VQGSRGRPRRKPDAIVGDRAYGTVDRIALVVALCIACLLAPRHLDTHGSGLGVWRYVVEQTIALLHQFRRLRTRFDKRDDVHEAFLELGVCVICWRRLERGYF